MKTLNTAAEAQRHARRAPPWHARSVHPQHPAGGYAAPPGGRVYRAAKRSLDIGVAIAGIVLLSPVYLLLTALVWIDSGHPIFFGHLRVGRHGQLFRCWKFRTMCADAEAILRRTPELYDLYIDNNYKVPSEFDPRVTRFGKFLRKSSLDELPQFFNVLTGDMSLIGPRPVVPEELGWYDGTVREFLSVRPGITGRWQIQGRSRIGYPDRTKVEIEGVRRSSFWNDVKVLLLSIPVLWTGRGSL